MVLAIFEQIKIAILLNQLNKKYILFHNKLEFDGLQCFDFGMFWHPDRTDLIFCKNCFDCFDNAEFLNCFETLWYFGKLLELGPVYP